MSCLPAAVPPQEDPAPAVRHAAARVLLVQKVWREVPGRADAGRTRGAVLAQGVCTAVMVSGCSVMFVDVFGFLGDASKWALMDGDQHGDFACLPIVA